MAPKRYTLYTPSGSFRAFAPLIAAEFNQVDVIVDTEGAEEAAKSKSPTGQIPLLETEDGVVFSSHAIARFLGGIRQDTGLLGKTFQERAMVNQWIDWTSAEVELPACIIFYPAAGYMSADPERKALATDDLKKVLHILEDHLSGKEFLVGENVTLADIVLSSTLLYPFKLVLDNEFLKPYENVVRWFKECIQKEEFVSVLGEVELFNGSQST